MSITLKQTKALYLSLREQYLSDRPMSNSEESQMWSLSHILISKGWKWARIKNNQLRI
jgi:hypothetical protein